MNGRAVLRHLKLPPPADWRHVLIAAVLGAALTTGAVWLITSGRTDRAAGAAPQAAATALADLPARPDTLAPQPLLPLERDEARARNAAVPFADTNPPAAQPFRFEGGALDRARATDCLAIAAMAEAGDSDEGQRAVMQVVLNRVRHPAFVRTVCGVVFQGSERATGCQFTFTCDGALRRRYGEAAWAAARLRAQEALGGRVYAPVGLATHYHTDWVYPYWSSELDKIARVDTHLFFRWRGFWGTPAAARATYGGKEPAIRALAALAASHAGDATEALPDIAQAEAAPGVRHDGGSEVIVRHPGGAGYFVHLGLAATANAALTLGRELCGSKGHCQVMAWMDRAAVPNAFPITPVAREALSFTYVYGLDEKEVVFYDCRHFTGVARANCIPPPQRAY